MKFTNKIIVFIILISSIQTFGQRTKIDGVAAVVGKNIVLYSEVKAAKAQLEQSNEGESKYTECNIIEKILNDKLLAHHAVIDSLTVDESRINSEVDRKIEYFKQQLGTQEKLLDFFGFSSLTDIKKELFNVEKESQLVAQMQQTITTGTDVTPEEVSSYFKSLKKEGAVPEFGTEVEIGQIVLEAKADEKAEQELIKKLNKFKKEIEAGSSFKMKAIMYSQDPAATKKGEGSGGLYHGITKQTQFVKEFKDAAFSLEEGEMSEPFKSQFGFHIVQVVKIVGKSRDVRHILLQSEVSDEVLSKLKDSIVSIRKDILTDKISFKDAVKKYSSDKETNKNYGLLINPQRNDTFFDLTNMPPEIYSRISELKEGEFSEVFYDETREGQKMYKFLFVKSKILSHKANLDSDYVKIKRLALAKKRSELVQEWTNDKIGDTYIKIHDQYKDCDFEYNWTKK